MYGKIVLLERDQIAFFFSHPLYALIFIGTVVFASMLTAFSGFDLVYTLLVNIIPPMVLLIYLRSRMAIYGIRKPVVYTFFTLAVYFVNFLGLSCYIQFKFQNEIPFPFIMIAIYVYWHFYFVSINVFLRRVPVFKYLLKTIPILFLSAPIYLVFAWILLINSFMLSTTNDIVYQKIFWMLSLAVLFFFVVVLYEVPFKSNRREKGLESIKNDAA